MAPTLTRVRCIEGETTEGEAERRGPTAHERPVALAVRRAQAGDRDALAFLYARYADNVHGYVRSIVQDHHEAEEVTQHVFTKLMQAIGRYEPREAPFLAWLMRVARNAALDHLRRQRLVPVEEVRIADGARSEATSTSDLREALSTLPQAQREVLVLRHIAGLSPVEIARRTGRSESAIHGLHHRGRRALIAALNSRGAAPATMSRA